MSMHALYDKLHRADMPTSGWILQIPGVGALIGWGAGAPVDGTTGDNIAATGGEYHDTTNGTVYVNTGTKTAPVWTVTGTQTT